MKRIAIGILAALLTAAAQKTDEAERLLKAARNTELVDGDLKAAIEQYRKVSRTGNRGLAAQALIRMAECYQKLGDAESRKIYERVLQEYADQKESAAIARTRLGRNETASESGIMVRRVWEGEACNIEGRPSADGRYFPYIECSPTPNLAVRDLVTGVNRQLIKDATPTGLRVLSSVASPDGKYVAYHWRARDRVSTVRIVGTDGSGDRLLFKSKELDWLNLQGWSPDGKYIAVLETSGAPGSSADYSRRVRRIGLLSVADGTLRHLKSPVWRPDGVRIGGFSPDGRFLVYSLPRSSSSSADGGVFALPADGGEETVLVQGQSNESFPAWAPDGHSVVFVSDRSGTQDLWTIRVANGKPQGTAELLRPNVGDMEILGFSRTGALYYGVTNRRRDVYAAAIDPETLRVTAPPARLTDRMVGSNWGPSWSPDGKWLAFYRRIDAKANGLVIRSVATGEERTLPRRFEHLIAGLNVGAEWFPDSRSVLAPDLAGSDRAVFRRIDIETGQERVVFEAPYPNTYTATKLSPDGKSLYYSRTAGREGPLYLIKRNLETGEGVELYRTDSRGVGAFGLAVSPDGARLSFGVNREDYRELMTLPAEGGTPTTLFRGTFAGNFPMTGAWTKDGRYVLTIGAQQDGLRYHLWATPVGGGERQQLDISFQRMHGLSISPDGRRVAFGGYEAKQELWVIQNLLPGMRESR